MLVEPTTSCFVDSERKRFVYVWGFQGAEYRTPAGTGTRGLESLT